MPDETGVGPSLPFMDRLTQRLRGQRSSTSLMKGKDVELEKVKKKKKS